MIHLHPLAQAADLLAGADWEFSNQVKFVYHSRSPQISTIYKWSSGEGTTIRCMSGTAPNGDGTMGMEYHGTGMGHHGMERNPCMEMIWEKADDEMKKKIRLRMLDEKIMHKEHCIQQLQHKVETMKMIRGWIEKV